MGKINSVINKFGKTGTIDLSSAILKERRYLNATAICRPQVFMGARFMERETQFRLLDSFLFQPKNAKQKRNLIVAVAASGMGKSAFVDEYCRRTTDSCIAITYNTVEFGSQLGETITVAVDLAARLLMSYFLSNPSPELLGKICQSLLEANFRPGDEKEMLQAVVECVKEDLRMQSCATKSKILIACDEVGNSRDEKLVVQLLCTLIDGDDDVECFLTGLTLNPFLKESSSGRNIKYVPLPLLTFATSLKLVQSFVTEPKVSSKLARLSGGHARTIDTFENIVTSSPMRALPWTDDKKFQTVVESTFSYLDRRVSEEEIMLLLRTRTLLSDVRKNTDLQIALENGNLYATVRDNNYVELYTSPMLLRNSLRQLQAEGNNNELLAILNELLALVGLRDWAEFRAVNRQQNGKIFENFFLRMEMLRRSFQESQLGKEKIKIADLYPSVSYQQNCKTVRYELADSYDVVDVSCQSDFPSTNPVDAAVVKSVKALVDNADSINKIVRPTKETQAAYDFFFILKDSSSNKRFVQLIEPTISAGGPDSDAYFIKRYVDKLTRAESLAWDQLGIDMKDIVYTFISTGDTSGIDWATEFQDAGYSDSRILILDRADVTAFYAPMMNLLFSNCLDDINLQTPPAPCIVVSPAV